MSPSGLSICGRSSAMRRAGPAASQMSDAAGLERQLPLIENA